MIWVVGERYHKIMGRVEKACIRSWNLLRKL